MGWAVMSLGHHEDTEALAADLSKDLGRKVNI